MSNNPWKMATDDKYVDNENNTNGDVFPRKGHPWIAEEWRRKDSTLL